MASARDLRILSLQALYALDMADGRDPDAIRAAIESGNTLDAADDTPRPAAPAPKETLLAAAVAFAVSLAILVLFVVALAQVRRPPSGSQV